jgi:hypothetical protein
LYSAYQYLLLQVNLLSSKLQSNQQQLHQTQHSLADAQSQISDLQSSLLQQTAIAEAVQGQLAAICLTQQLQAMLPSGTPDTAEVRCASSKCRDVSCSDTAVSGQLLAMPLPTSDPISSQQEWQGEAHPKVQRIQELRAALAAALCEVKSAAAAEAAAYHQQQQQQQQQQEGEQQICDTDWYSDLHSADPKVARIRELTAALTAAAAEFGRAARVAPAAAAKADDASFGDADAKQARIVELRAALSQVSRERDLLRQQLAALAPSLAQDLMDPGAQQEAAGNQVMPQVIHWVCI